LSPLNSVEAKVWIVHTSTAEMGGAETSLFETLKGQRNKPHFLVPGEGPLTEAILKAGFTFQVLAWPWGLAKITQRRWIWFPLVLPSLLPYLFKLYSAASGLRKTSGLLKNSGIQATFWSSGFKSHCACLLLSPWLGSLLLFDIRDFLRPLFLRRMIAWAVSKFGCRVRANSQAVGKDFPGVEVHYPLVNSARIPVNARHAEGKKIIVHLAFFAPYKGQDLFLTCARKLLDAGLDAEFWLIGDVIYPAQVYLRYRENLYAQAAKLRLTNHVRFLGKVAGGEPVQKLLEQAHLLLHCTREPEPFGRVALEALLYGCEVICHGGSGVCEVTQVNGAFPVWTKPLDQILGSEYVSLSLRSGA
jgi:glycosyltransferase involved in cell wall biosynthesis